MLPMSLFAPVVSLLSYRSQDGNEVVRIHQYLRKTGEIGASGKPDPKRIYTNGIIYKLAKKKTI